MARVSIASLLISSVVVLATFGQGVGVLRGGDVAAHLQWAMATLMCVLAANLIAMVHAAQSDRLIRTLRAELERKNPVPNPSASAEDAHREGDLR